MKHATNYFQVIHNFRLNNKCISITNNLIKNTEHFPIHFILVQIFIEYSNKDVFVEFIKSIDIKYYEQPFLKTG
jgi:hypothetical protein